MAFRKPIELETGVKADYWRVVEIQHNFKNRTTRIVLQLYLNEEARRSGKEPLPIYEQVFFHPEDHEFGVDMADDLLKAIYEHLKAVMSEAERNKENGELHLMRGSAIMLEKLFGASDA